VQTRRCIEGGASAHRFRLPEGTWKMPDQTQIAVQSSEKARPLSAFLKRVRNSPLFIFGVIAIVLSITVPNFLSVRNIVNLLTQSSTVGLMALGMTFVLILGGLDLSIPANMAFSGILGAIYMRDIGSPVTAALIMVAMGTAVGCVNGFAVAKLRMIPFIVTLSMQAILIGSSIWITKNDSVYNLPEVFSDTILHRFGIVPVPVLVLFAVTLVTHMVLKRSFFGRWIYYVGINRDAAEVSGIPSQMVTFFGYVISGFFAGLAAVIVTARLNSASATMGSENIVLDIVSSCVVGGVSIYGGVGTALGAVVGVLFVTVITNTMNLLHVPYYLTLVIKGLVIISVVGFDSLRSLRRS
jgi:ribose/xylose/arabinose/galactoside ABC-type transport system permease subunit